ncbi:hypothetical protein BJ170DRAFT_435287 [Xylariales sp. AK1849]|nr:hypothetical protein BJ170DRAFT_435287 [Xylariales sp. AK1849]
MRQVYVSAYLSIAALGASTSADGLYCSRNPLIGRPCLLGTSTHGDELYVYWNGFRSHFWKHLYDNAPLHTRGWVLQERLLAPRTLNYGVKVTWECRRGNFDELGYTPLDFR